MYCQVCGARNREDQEYCRHCHQKLMVVSGVQALEEQEAYDSNPEEQFSFDEHLLERISILEEVVKRTTESVRQALGTLYKLEQQILVNQTSITTLRDLLESKQLIAREEWSELWESRMDYQLLALDKRRRFAAAKDKIAGLYGGEDPEEFHRLLEEAEYALLALDVESAVRALDRAHRRDASNYELAFFLGETFFNEGDGDTALGYLNHVLAVKPSHFESLVLGGVLYQERHDAARAEELLKRAVAHYPDAFLPAFSLGAVYAARGRLSEAAVLLERAAGIDPIPQALYLLGSCCYEMGRVGAAIRHLRAAVRMDPAYEEAHHLLGLAYLDRRWFKKALAALGEAQRLRPHQQRHHGMALLAAGEREQARRTLVRARDFDDGTRGEKVLECLKDGARRLHHAAP
jgi:tetratricopeptide (TPR) repeat protein